MDIIPLIQTFGHFEWLLKLHEFRSYRDNPVSPMVISPCLEETYVLIEGQRTFEPEQSKRSTSLM